MLECLHPGGVELTRRAVEACSPRRGERLVDIGCGNGASVAYLRQAYSIETLGFDTRGDALQTGRAAALELRLACARGDFLPLAAESCDIVLAECSLSTMGSLPAALAECRRVLAPGGRLAIHDLYRRRPCGPAHPPDKAGWIQQLEAAGFVLQAWEDHTPALTALAAQAIFAGRSLASLWGCRPAAAVSPSNLTALGYFLAVAGPSGDTPLRRIAGPKIEE